MGSVSAERAHTPHLGFYYGSSLRTKKLFLNSRISVPF